MSLPLKIKQKMAIQVVELLVYKYKPIIEDYAVGALSRQLPDGDPVYKAKVSETCGNGFSGAIKVVFMMNREDENIHEAVCMLAVFYSYENKLREFVDKTIQLFLEKHNTNQQIPEDDNLWWDFFGDSFAIEYPKFLQEEAK